MPSIKQTARVKTDNSFKTFWQEYNRIILFAGGIIAVTIILAVLQHLIIPQLSPNNILYQGYMNARAHITSINYSWLFWITLIGSTIFITFPVQFFGVYYILAGANMWLVVGIVISATTIGRIINYLVGFFFSRLVRKKILKGDVKEFNRKFNKWGISLLIFGNFIPFFPLEALGVFLGSVKFRFWKYLLYTVIGKCIEFIILALVMTYFMKYGLGILRFNAFEFLKLIFL